MAASVLAVAPSRADGGTGVSAGASTGTGAAASAGAASSAGASTSSIPDPAAAGLSTLGGAPPFGTAVRLGDVGTLLDQSGAASPGASAPGIGVGEGAPFLTIVPSIGATEQYATGGYGGSFGNRGGGGTFVTSIDPALLINGATRRTTFTLNYDPRIQFYSGGAGNNGIDQSLDGAIDAVLLPQTLQVAARAYATEQATSGGLSPGGSSLYNRHNQTQTQSYSVTPTFNDNFEYGMLNLLYSAQYTKQSGNAAFLQGARNPYFRNSDVFAQTEAGSFTTIPFFGRFNDTPSVSATEDVGTGVLSGAHQYFAKDTVHYALTRLVVLSASGGYEDILYAGIPPTSIRDATWSLGARILFPEGGILVARYQHLYGFNSPYIRLSYAITARTTLALGYSEVLSTQQQGIGLGVASSGVNSIGLPVGGLTGQPVLLTNQSLSVQSGLTRNKQFSANLTTQFTRDVASVSLQAYQDVLVANAPGTAGFSQKGAYISLSDSHALSPRANALFYLNYGRTQSPALGSSSNRSTYGASAAISYRLWPSVYSNAQYSLTNQSYSDFGNGTGFGNGGVQNIITIGIRKTF